MTVLESSRLQRAIVTLAVLTAGGTAWYALVERFAWVDAFFMAVITLSTVGFSEVQPLDDSGRVFTALYILVGVGLVFYTASLVAEQVVVGTMLRGLGLAGLRRRRHNVRQHIIVCGYGRVGREVAHVLRQRGERVLVIDIDPERIDQAHNDHCEVLLGDATDEQRLHEARVEHARVLIAAAESDADNTFITLTAKTLHPGVVVVARAGSASGEQRLQTAGADRVISPYRIAGSRMAMAAVQPAILEFFDSLTDRDREHAILAEILIDEEGASLRDLTVQEVFAHTDDLRLLGISRADGELVVGPGGAHRLAGGDRLLVYGEQPAIEAMLASRAGARRG